MKKLVRDSKRGDGWERWEPRWLVMWDVEVHGYLVDFVKSMIVLSDICPNMSFLGAQVYFFRKDRMSIRRTFITVDHTCFSCY